MNQGNINSTSVNNIDNNVNESSVLELKNTSDIDESSEVIYDLSASESHEVGVVVDHVNVEPSNIVDDSFMPEPTLIIDDTHEEIGKVVDKVIDAKPSIEEQIPEATLVIEDTGESHVKTDDLVVAGLDRTVDKHHNVIIEKREDVNEDIVPENYEEELMKIYIGNGYDTIIKKGYSFPALIFSYFYVFYRKMFILPFVSFLVCTFLVYITDMWFFYLLPCLLFAFTFNRLYVKKAEKYVSKIKSKINNKKYSIIKIDCKNDGGTSFNFSVLGLLLFVVVILGFAFLLVKNGKESLFTQIFDVIGLDVSYLDKTKEPEIQKNNIYSGVLMEDKDVNIKNHFNINVTNSKFNNDSTDYSYYYNYYSGDGKYDKCEFRFFSPIGYVDGNDLSFQMNKYYMDSHSSEVERIFSSGEIKWNKFYYSSSYGLSYIYITNKDGKVFILEYNIQESADLDCVSYNDDILNNISLVK